MTRTATALTGVLLLGFVANRAAAGAADSTPAANAPKPVIRISPETTRVSGPLDADGYVDFLAAVNQHYGRGVPLSENAAELLLEALGTNRTLQSFTDAYGNHNEVDTLRDVRVALGMPRDSNQPGLYGIGDYVREVHPGVAAAELGQHSQSVIDAQTMSQSRPWSAEEFPAMAAILKRNEAALALVHRAVQRPKYFRPLTLPKPGATMVAILLPDVQQHRELARLLKSRAMLKLHQGQIDAARQDLYDLHRLARCSGRGVTLIDGLVGIAIDAMATQGDNVWANHSGVTAVQLSAYRTQLAQLPPVTDLVDRVDHVERYFLLDIMQKMARGTLPNEEVRGIFGLSEDAQQVRSMFDMGAIIKALALLSVDWNVAMTDANQFYDELVAAGRTPNRTERLALYDEWEQRLKQEKARLAGSGGAEGAAMAAFRFAFGSKESRGRDFGSLLSTLLLPAVRQATSAEDAGRLRLQMTAVVLALAEYRVANGNYPEKLAALAPQYLPAIPQDLFSGGDLHYDTDGAAYRLYSVGRNGRDDGGVMGSNGADDIVYSDPVVVP